MSASDEAWRQKLREAGWRVVGEAKKLTLRRRLLHDPGASANLVPSDDERDCAGASCDDDPDGIPDP